MLEFSSAIHDNILIKYFWRKITRNCRFTWEPHYKSNNIILTDIGEYKEMKTKSVKWFKPIFGY